MMRPSEPEFPDRERERIHELLDARRSAASADRGREARVDALRGASPTARRRYLELALIDDLVAEAGATDRISAVVADAADETAVRRAQRIATGHAVRSGRGASGFSRLLPAAAALVVISLLGFLVSRSPLTASPDETARVSVDDPQLLAVDLGSQTPLVHVVWIYPTAGRNSR